MVEEIAQVVANLESKYKQNRTTLDKAVHTEMTNLTKDLKTEMSYIKKRQEKLCYLYNSSIDQASGVLSDYIEQDLLEPELFNTVVQDDSEEDENYKLKLQSEKELK